MSGNSFLLDTNIIIGYLKGEGYVVHFLEEHASAELYASVITRMELLSFADITLEEEQIILDFLDYVTVVPLSEEVENIAVTLRRDTHAKIPDAIVAASAVSLGSTLVTCDKRLASLTFPGLFIFSPTA